MPIWNQVSSVLATNHECRANIDCNVFVFYLFQNLTQLSKSSGTKTCFIQNRIHVSDTNNVSNRGHAHSYVCTN